VPVVMCPEDGCLPGIYCYNLLSKPWLSDGSTMILSSIWDNIEVILSVNVLRKSGRHIEQEGHHNNKQDYRTHKDRQTYKGKHTRKELAADTMTSVNKIMEDIISLGYLCIKNRASFRNVSWLDWCSFSF
ncbi:hypothetical protein M8C21_021739, partial [Ambrosia artemisiifolia]